MAAGQACQDDRHAANGFAVQRHGRGLRAVHFAGRMVQLSMDALEIINGISLNVSGPTCAAQFRKRFPMLLGMVFGSVSFTGSLVAFGKLQGLITEKPVRWPLPEIHQRRAARRHSGGGGGSGAASPGRANLDYSRWRSRPWLLGVLQVLPIGGADMPVVISVLNSCTGLAAALTGFAMQNMSMIIAGTLVGAAGSLLTVLMCKAMNRSLAKVVFGSFGLAPAGAAAGRRPRRPVHARNRRLRMRHHDGLRAQSDYHSRLRTGRRPGPAPGP